MRKSHANRVDCGALAEKVMEKMGVGRGKMHGTGGWDGRGTGGGHG